ncbi:putative uncharacterized protein [Prevotella sp. CAG:1185]|nr:putative uncharacterized protein [Prevotella sp. CAG:1185]
MLFSFSLFIRRRAMAVVSLSLLAVAASAQEPFGSSHINDDDSHTDSVPSAFQDKLMNEAYTPEFSVPMPESRFTRSTFSRMMLSVQPPKPKFHVDSIDRLMLYGTPEPKFTASPYAYDFNRSGVVTSWKNGFLMGYGSRTTMPVMMSNQNVSFSAVQNVGNFTFTGGVSADRYFMWRNTRTMFGFNGSVKYNFSDNVSATVFGRYYTGQSYYTMGAMPYMGSSGYGGFFSFMGNTFGMDVGVERYYDSFAGRWVTSPIITPKIKFSEKFTLALPVGGLVKELFDDYVFKNNKNQGPIIMPETTPMPGPIPFGPPEINYHK